MRDWLIGRILPGIAVLCAGAAVVYALYGRTGPDLKRRDPVPEIVPPVDQVFEPTARKAIIPVAAGKPGESNGDWPNFRGPERDGICHDKVALTRSWPAEGPKQLWGMDLGEGHAGPAVHNGRIYLLDYDPPDWWYIRPDEVKDWDVLRAKLSVREGKADDGVLARIRQLMPPASPAVESVKEKDIGKVAMLVGLSGIVDNKDFFRPGFMAELNVPAEEANVALDKKTEGGKETYVLKPRLKTAQLRRFNRLLLDLALAPAIEKSEHADVLRCISTDDDDGKGGRKEIWRFAYPVELAYDHGMSRTVPAVTDKYVVSIGPNCHVLCLDAVTGSPLWGIDLIGQYRTKRPQWYAAQCPLIDGDRAIIAPGGTSLMIAVELSTGKVLWKTPNPHGWKMTHSSIATMEVGGRKMYVYCAGIVPDGGVVGVDAKTGEVLWETDAWVVTNACVASPVPVGDGRLFLSSGYGAGCMMMQVVEEGGKFAIKELWRLPESQFGAVQQTPILYEGDLYGTRPDGQFVCLGLDGRIKWTSGAANKFGIYGGPYMIADGLIYVMDDDGKLTIAEASPDGFKKLAQARLLHNGDSWGPMAMYDGRLLVRDVRRMICLDVRK
ncbi:MAG: PQQ-binding-like beta-propeller repeat protein [Phycisphaerae bacterium]